MCVGIVFFFSFWFDSGFHTSRGIPAGTIADCVLRASQSRRALVCCGFIGCCGVKQFFGHCGALCDPCGDAWCVVGGNFVPRG